MQSHILYSKLGFFRIFLREIYQEMQMLIYATGSVVKQAKTHILINRNAVLHIYAK